MGWNLRAALGAVVRALAGSARRAAGLQCIALAALLAAPAMAVEDVDQIRARLEEARAAGVTRLEEAQLQHELGRALARRGEFDEAGTAFEGALRVRETALPADSPEIAATLTGLAVVRNAQGRFSDAERMFQRALEIRREHYGADSAEVAQSYGNLGALYVQTERWDDAARMLDRAIEAYEKSGERRSALVVSLAQRATLHERAGEVDQADRIYERIVEVESRNLGATSERVAEAHTALAGRYRERGDWKKAESHYTTALEILGQLESTSGPLVASNLGGLGWVELKRGKAEQAELYYGRALVVAESTMGRDNPFLIPLLEGYAQALRGLDRDDDASAYEARAARLEAAAEAARAKREAQRPAGEAPGGPAAPGATAP